MCNTERPQPGVLAWLACLLFCLSGCGRQADQSKTPREAQQPPPKKTVPAERVIDPPAKFAIDSKDDAAEVIRKAVEAHGGADKPVRWHRGFVKYRSTG